MCLAKFSNGLTKSLMDLPEYLPKNWGENLLRKGNLFVFYYYTYKFPKFSLLSLSTDLVQVGYPLSKFVIINSPDFRLDLLPSQRIRFGYRLNALEMNRSGSNCLRVCRYLFLFFFKNF